MTEHPITVDEVAELLAGGSTGAGPVDRRSAHAAVALAVAFTAGAPEDDFWPAVEAATIRLRARGFDDHELREGVRVVFEAFGEARRDFN